ncbi:MAG TPA: DUF4238 domain-containing protein [Candidatus Sulfotelmatobacter sp.]
MAILGGAQVRTLVHDSHYVPCFSLNSFADARGQVFTYRLLVSRSGVPEWKRSFPRAVAKYVHLYTRVAPGGVDSDEVEEWFNREFETPAAEPLAKATSGARLTPTDWRRLARFLAAQHVRTPASLVKHLERMRANLPSLMEKQLEPTVRDFEQAWRAGTPIVVPEAVEKEYLPLRVTTMKMDDGTGGVKVDVLVGRSSWLFSMKTVLNGSANVLADHRWTILRPPEDLCWFTSDDPVVCLNYYGDAHYNFAGGWEKSGSEIFMPLGPKHLLYTKVGHPVLPRGSVLPRVTAETLRRCIAQHAYRYIFATSPEPDVPEMRPRRIDADLFRSENENWRKWHELQSAAEREFLD